MKESTWAMKTRLRSVPSEAKEVAGFPGYFITKDGRVFTGAIELHPQDRPDGCRTLRLKDKEGKVRTVHVRKALRETFEID